MTPLFIVLAFFLGLGGEIKYPAICKDWYLSNEEVQSVETVTNTLSKRPDCMQIGEETITEGDRVGQVFPIYTCCTSIEAERE